MATLPPIFDTCKPRSDVLAGIKDEHFAADLAQIVNANDSVDYEVYRDPATFFRNTYPTRGLKSLLKAVCARLVGDTSDIGSIFRLDTQYGGGKTHGLIALIHAVRGMKGVANASEFIDLSLLPKNRVRVAALDGENSDPANGLTLEGDLRAYSPWGEMAYQLAGVEGYRRLEIGDKARVAPGAETIRELFGNEPTLILIDEVSVYLRKVEKIDPGAGKQFTAFLQALIKAVESSPKVVLVFTLAIGKDGEATDAYQAEHERVVEALAEAEAVASRKATQLNPTEEDETADVLRRRLFASVDPEAAKNAVAAYLDVWSKASLPTGIVTAELKEQFVRGYPLHPETLTVLTEKTSSLNNFHRTRGMLRLLARTVQVLWRDQPADALSIHPHHIDFGFGPIRDEVTTRLGQGAYTPAIKSDVAAVAGDSPSIAQMLDKDNPGSPPTVSYVARTIFMNTLASSDSAKGIKPDHLLFSICSPAIEPGFIEQARLRFAAESLYLDDRPGVPMRLMAEPNLQQVIRREMKQVDDDEVRNTLDLEIEKLFGRDGGKFQLIAFPEHPSDVPDEVGDGRPFLIVMGYNALAISSESQGLPPDIADYFRSKGADRGIRQLRNNLVFVVADERRRDEMKEWVRRRLALLELSKSNKLKALAEHQQNDVKARSQTSKMSLATAILQSYRHLFYPSNAPMAGATEPIAHAVMEIPKNSDKPGDGQLVIGRALREQKKLLDANDPPDSPGFVRDQTPLKTKGELTTQALRNEFRRAPKLSILLSDEPLKVGIRQGIDSEVFIYRQGDQVWGKGDPAPVIQVNENAFVHTIADARQKGLWPRPEKLTVSLVASTLKVKAGGAVMLTANVEGGTTPFTFASEVDQLRLTNTIQTASMVSVSPTSSTTYRVEVTDARGQKAAANISVSVEASDDSANSKGDDQKPTGGVVPPHDPIKPKQALTAEGPLAQALMELWEKARKAKHQALDKLIVRFFEPAPTWQIHQALAMMTKEVQATVCYEVMLSADGVEKMQVNFEGRLDKANAVRLFLDPQLRSAADHSFEASYTLVFPAGLPLASDRAEQFAKGLTRFGSGEAYVEAFAAAQGVLA